MKREGFISLLGLLLMASLIFSSCLLLYYSSLQGPITSLTLKNIQARYDLEEKVYRMVMDQDLFDEYLRYKILQGFRGSPPSDYKWRLGLTGHEFLGKDYVEGYLYQPDRENLDKMYLLASYRFENGLKNIEAELSLMNYFLKSDKALIWEEDLEEGELILFDKMMDELHDLSFDYDARPSISYYIYNMDEDTSIRKSENSLTNLLIGHNYKTYNIDKYKDKVFILYLIHPRDKRLSLTIEGEEEDSPLKLNGIFYIEGDLHINQSLDLEGMVIINDGSILIDEGKFLRINGKLIYRGASPLPGDRIMIEYNKRNVEKYGSFLPIFLDAKISYIRYK